MKLFIRYYKCKSISENFGRYPACYSTRMSKPMVISNSNKDKIRCFNQDFCNGWDRNNLQFMHYYLIATINAHYYCNSKNKFCVELLKCSEPASKFVILKRVLQINSHGALLQNITTKGDVKNDPNINKGQAPIPSSSLPATTVPTPTQNIQPVPALSSNIQQPIQTSTLYDPSIEEKIKHKDLKHSISLSNLTEERKKDQFDQKAVKVDVVTKSFLKKVADELKHYYHGFKLLFIDIAVSLSLLLRVLKGHTLRRREKNLLRRVVGDVFRLIPFSIIIVVPFMELLLPLIIKLFPNMLPSTFQTSAERENKLKQKLKVKLEMTKFLQETLSDITLAGKHHCVKCVEDAKEFSAFFEKVRTGNGMATNEEILKFSHLFSSNVTMDTIPRPQLMALCRVLDIQPFGTTTFLRFQIEMRLRNIRADDQVIMREGVDSLDLLELQQACHARGMRALGVSQDQLRSQLKQWIDLTQNSKVPETLLLLSRAFMFHDSEDRGRSQSVSAQHIAHAISTLPEAAGIIAKEHAGMVETIVDPREKIELIKEQYKMIREEIKEEKAEKARLDVAAKKNGAITKLSTKVDDSKQQYPFIKGEPVEIDGLLVCRPVSKTQLGVIGSEDAKAIKTGLEKLSKEIFTLEKQELVKLKDKLEEYKYDSSLLQEIPDTKIHESVAAQRLYKFTKNMTERLDKSIKELEDKEEVVKKNNIAVNKNSTDVRKKLFQIDELINVIKGLQKVSPEPDQRLKTIAEILLKMATDNNQETIRLETLLRVINLLQKEDLNLTTEQMDELIQLIKKEEFISLHNQIEKTLQHKESDSSKIKIKKEDTNKPEIIGNEKTKPHKRS